MTRRRPAELVCTLPNGEVSMPVMPVFDLTAADMVARAATMITRAVGPELLPSAIWTIRNGGSVLPSVG